MNLIKFIYFGYIILFGTLIIMIWVSLSGAREMDTIRYPPCYFNPLCSCSKGVPDLGIVRCQDIHLSKIPDTVNISKVFMLYLENNGLRFIEPYFLQSTGLYKIVITKNPLWIIPDEAFLGLERSLWELDLSYNQLAYVPNRALRYLQRLRLLDLTGNEIIKISPDNWRGLESSLTSLILADNSITMLPIDSFSGLPNLETLDLKGNNLKEIDPSVFRDGMDKLAHLILADNQLSNIPYQALYPLRMLKTLDLSYNIINRMQPATEIGGQIINLNFQLNLNILKLDYNQITYLESGAFQYFNFLNKTYLNGNPLDKLEENAFRQAKIKELYMRNCDLQNISPLVFNGLENYLEILDLSENNISQLAEEMFENFQLLQVLLLKDNSIENFNPTLFFKGLQFTLYEMDLSGTMMSTVNIQDLKRLRNLRILSLSKLTQSSLNPDEFLEFGTDVEELEIISSNLKSIKNYAFRYVHGLKYLDFSENSIDTIDNEAFIDIGHSLNRLKLSYALSSSMQTLPSESLKTLTNLEELDMSNNKIKIIPETSFHLLKNLKILYMHDNLIENIQKGIFQGDIHYELKCIYLSFNNIKSIQQHTFVDLSNLEQLHLDDNKITSLERRSFMNLEKLKRLNLKGNKITKISYETFQNLPELEDLDLSYNQMDHLDFTMFDQVGTLTLFSVNISHNKIDDLINSATINFDSDLGSGSFHSNIKMLDISYNNITMIMRQFFKPVELSLTHIYLHHNYLFNATREMFGNMPHLQVLDLSFNRLYDLDFDSFRNTKRLQIFSASHNRIADIPNDLFKFLSNLRVVDFSHNRLRILPDNLFREGSIERLDLSHNMLSKLPLSSLSVAGANNICEMDLSWNSISSLAHGGLFSRFKSLLYLDLSYNRLAQIDGGTFRENRKLLFLDLGHNNQLALEENGMSLQGLEYNLLHLNIDNLSLNYVPQLPTPHLLTLSLAYNSLPTIPPEMATNLTQLRGLDLSYNDLTIVPIVTHSLPELRYLNLGSNPINIITNTSLLGIVGHIIELDLSNLPINNFESGALCKMQSLKILHIDLDKNVKNFNIPRILRNSKGLENLIINMDQDNFDIDTEMQGTFPYKLRNITFTGKGLKRIPPYVLQGLNGPYLYLNFQNTSLQKIPSELFENVGRVRNLSVTVHDNDLMKNIKNPSTGSRPNLPDKTFLINFSISGGKWSCDCDLGWIEVWQRKRRQYICTAGPSLAASSQSLHSFDYKCRHADDDLRTTICANKNNQSLLEILKSEIECGWSNSSLPNKFNIIYYFLIIIFLSQFFL